MIRFLDDREISSLKSTYNKIISLKILSLDKNVTRFYKGELSLDKAVKTYIHLVNANYYSKFSLEDTNKVMKEYMSKYSDSFQIFLDEVEAYCDVYDENSDYYDEMYEIFENIIESIMYAFNSTLKEYSSIYVSSIYALIYDFHDDDIFDDETRNVFFRVRKEVIEYAGGICKATYWYPESMKNLPIEEKLPDECDLQDLIQCECNIIAIKLNESFKLTNDVYLTRSFNRVIENSGYGVGIVSECYIENNTFFITLTSEASMSIKYESFLMLTVVIYMIERRCFFGKNDCRVS